MRKLLSIYIFLTLWVLNFSSFAATRTANAGGGDWNTAATWDCNCIPTAADDVVIPAGVTVTSSVSISSFKSITVNINAKLNITGSLIFSQGITQALDNFGTITTTGDVSITNSFGGLNIILESTGSLIVGGSFTDTDATLKYVKNYGYIEVTSDFIGKVETFTNYSTGTILIHNQFRGTSGGNFKIYNYGIITIDKDLVIMYSEFFNYTNGKFFVFGNINQDSGSNFTNQGLIQCNIFHYVTSGTGGSSAGTFTNVGGTLIALIKFQSDGTTCAACDVIGNMYSGSFDASGSWCHGLNCAVWMGNNSNTVTKDRKMWYAADFIGYGLENDGMKIDKWFDLANTYGFKMSENVSGNPPTLKDNVNDNVNYNPMVSFTGNAHLDLNGDFPSVSSSLPDGGGIAIFAVVVPDALTTGTRFVSDFGAYPSKGFGLAYSAQDAIAYTPNSANGITQTDAHGRGTVPTIVSMVVNFGASGSQSLTYNGKTPPVKSNSITLNALTNTEVAQFNPPTVGKGPFTLGAQSQDPTSLDFEGKLGEYILYGRKVSDPEILSNQSFLALKYGITVEHDILDYKNTLVRTYDPAYKYDLAGLVREDFNHLQQRQSHSINPGCELLVSAGTFVTQNERTVGTDIANNSSYLIWSHNNGTVGTLGRVYKFSAKNFNQSVKLRFTIPGLSPTPQLMIADDPGFTTNVRYVTATSYTDPILDYTVTFTDNKSQYCVLKVPAAASTPGVLISETAPYPTIKNTAELQIYSKSRGVLLPTMTSTTLPANPPKGLLVYCTDVKRYMYYNGTAWNYVGGLINKLETDLSTYFGTYLGQLVYTTDTKFVYYWNGTSWVKLQ